MSLRQIMAMRSRIRRAGKHDYGRQAGGAQVFILRRSLNALDKSRTNIGAYIDAELDINEKFMVVQPALRKLQRFWLGNISWKLASRYELFGNLPCVHRPAPDLERPLCNNVILTALIPILYRRSYRCRYIAQLQQNCTRIRHTKSYRRNFV